MYRLIFLPTQGTRCLLEPLEAMIDETLPLCRNIGDSRIACLKSTTNDQTPRWST